MKSTKVTNLILGLITAIGGFLVSEQVISGEQLTEIQGITGMVLTGGGISILTIIGLIKTFIPVQVAKQVIENVGQEKVNKVLDTIDSVNNEVQALKDLISALENQLLLERKAKAELGAYDGVSQETKDEMNV